MGEPETFGDRVRRLRGRRKRAEIADLAGMPYSTLAELENTGKESTRCEYIVGLASALRVTTYELLSGRKDPMESVRLTSAEKDLLNAYRAASASERRQIDAYIAGMASRQKRPRRSQSGPLGDAGSAAAV